MAKEHKQYMTTSWRYTVALLGYRLSQEQEIAFDYLEAMGQRFCVHFGMDNGLQMAVDHCVARLERHG